MGKIQTMLLGMMEMLMCRSGNDISMVVVYNTNHGYQRKSLFHKWTTHTYSVKVKVGLQ